jgi:hypothetical protein
VIPAHQVLPSGRVEILTITLSASIRGAARISAVSKEDNISITKATVHLETYSRSEFTSEST